MTDRDAELALADKLEFAASNTEGCLYSQRKMLNEAATLLRATRRDEPVAWRMRLTASEDGWYFYKKKPSEHPRYKIEPLYAHPAASQGDAREEACNKLLRRLEDYWKGRAGPSLVELVADWQREYGISSSPERAAALPMREALDLIDELLALLVYKNEDHQRARDFVSRHRAALAPASANEVKHD